MDPLGMLVLLALFLRGRGKPAAAKPGRASTPAARADFANEWVKRTGSLMSRARGGAVWAPRMSKLLGTPAAGAAAARWIGIESGGNPRITSKLEERGLAQVSKAELPQINMTLAQYDEMIDPKTSDDRHAELAAKVIWGELVTVTKTQGPRGPKPGWGPPVGPAPLTLGVISVNGIGFAKLRHALPLLVRELGEQNHFRTSIDATIRSMLTGGTVIVGNGGVRVGPFEPSERLRAFVKGEHAVTGDPVKDLALRFFAPLAVIAHAEGARNLGAQAVS